VGLGLFPTEYGLRVAEMSESVNPTDPQKEPISPGVGRWMIVAGVILVALGLAGAIVRLSTMNVVGGYSKNKDNVSRAVGINLEMAIQQFYLEYDRLPDPRATPVATDAAFDTGSADGVRLLAILLGKETGPDIQNTKRMAFLTVAEGKNRKNGMIYSGSNVEGLFDPFGRGYRVMIDYDGDGQLTAPRESGVTGVLKNHHSAVYSLGPDGKGGSDAVRSW